MSSLLFSQTILLFLYFTACNTYIDKYIIAKTDDSSYCNSGTAESISIWWGQSFTLILVYFFKIMISSVESIFFFTFSSNYLGTKFYPVFRILFKSWHILQRPIAHCVSFFVQILVGTCPHLSPSDSLFRRPCQGYRTIANLMTHRLISYSCRAVVRVALIMERVGRSMRSTSNKKMKKKDICSIS